MMKILLFSYSITKTETPIAAEMWFYRRMLKVSWTQRITNEEILNRVLYPVRLLDVIRGRQLKFLGH